MKRQYDFSGIQHEEKLRIQSEERAIWREQTLEKEQVYFFVVLEWMMKIDMSLFIRVSVVVLSRIVNASILYKILMS